LPYWWFVQQKNKIKLNLSLRDERNQLMWVTRYSVIESLPSNTGQVLRSHL
jgi:hypothetical protein